MAVKVSPYLEGKTVFQKPLGPRVTASSEGGNFLYHSLLQPARLLQGLIVTVVGGESNGLDVWAIRYAQIAKTIENTKNSCIFVLPRTRHDLNLEISFHGIGVRFNASIPARANMLDFDTSENVIG